MDWTAALDNYCERLGPGLWAEPLNLLSNAAFLLAAAVMMARCRGMARGQVLAGALFLIGIGSALFHSVATVWASLADVVPIAVFVLLYLHAANRDLLNLSRPAAVLVTLLAFSAVVMAASLLGRAAPKLGANAAYVAVAALILCYGLGLLRIRRRTGRGLLLGAGILTVSIACRMLDAPLCPRWPPGTHFLWHLLNALMLGWMIEVWRRHMLEEGDRGG